MPFNSNMGFSPAGQALGLGGLAGIPGLGAGFGLGDQQESEDERRKRLGMVAQQRGQLPLSKALAGHTEFVWWGISGVNGTGRLF